MAYLLSLEEAGPNLLKVSESALACVARCYALPPVTINGRRFTPAGFTNCQPSVGKMSVSFLGLTLERSRRCPHPQRRLFHGWAAGL